MAKAKRKGDDAYNFTDGLNLDKCSHSDIIKLANFYNV
jgi:hypothetical protein